MKEFLKKGKNRFGLTCFALGIAVTILFSLACGFLPRSRVNFSENGYTVKDVVGAMWRGEI